MGGAGKSPVTACLAELLDAAGHNVAILTRGYGRKSRADIVVPKGGEAAVKETGDEAQALLETWKLSYFRSTGLRLFFMVPRAWTDLYLPLHISTPAELTRVMVGRIELVTAMQREYLRQLAQIPRDRIHADALALHERYYNLLDNPRSAAVASGAESLEAFGVEVPASYRLYLSLGRFRNALLLNQAREHPSPSLDQFIATYHLESYKPGSLAAAN